MVKLIEVLGTKTIMDSHHMDLIRIMSECKENNDTLDVTDAGMVPTIAKSVMSFIYSDGLKVVDYKSEARQKRFDATLERREHELALNSMPTQDMPVLTEVAMTPIYIRALSLDTVYKFDFNKYSSEDKDMMLGLLIVIILTRPKVNIDLSAPGTMGMLFKRVSNGFCARRRSLMIKTFDEFYFYNDKEFITETIKVRDLNEVFNFQGAPTTWNQLFSKYVVVPTFFGKEKLRVPNDKMTPAERERAEVISDIFSNVDGAAQGSIIKHFENKQKRGKSLIDFVKESNRNAL